MILAGIQISMNRKTMHHHRICSLCLVSTRPAYVALNYEVEKITIKVDIANVQTVEYHKENVYPEILALVSYFKLHVTGYL